MTAVVAVAGAERCAAGTVITTEAGTGLEAAPEGPIVSGVAVLVVARTLRGCGVRRRVGGALGATEAATGAEPAAAAEPFGPARSAAV